MKKAVLIYSGGLDSTTLLYHLLSKNMQVKCISFDYGQKHSKELLVAKKICKNLGVEHKICSLKNLSFIFKGSALTSKDIEIPDASYEEENMKKTVVPNRNMVFLSIATSWAISLDFDYVAYGPHAGDHDIYPDCRASFTKKMAQLISICDWKKIKLITPFVKFDKAKIVKKAKKLDVPLEETWSCYKGGKYHCGKCSTCTERKQAFKNAKVKDKTIYLDKKNK